LNGIAVPAWDETCNRANVLYLTLFRWTGAIVRLYTITEFLTNKDSVAATCWHRGRLYSHQLLTVLHSPHFHSSTRCHRMRLCQERIGSAEYCPVAFRSLPCGWPRLSGQVAHPWTEPQSAMEHSRLGAKNCQAPTCHSLTARLSYRAVPQSRLQLP
jgi:hypothetical protein